MENTKMIRLSKSIISNKEKAAVNEVLDLGFLGMGAKVGIFEKKLSKFFGRNVSCVVNGTSALHLALQAVGIKKGDEVLVPSITYVASFQAITATGAKPVPCDINLNNFTLSCKDAENRINSNTKAIMPVHYAGDCGNLDAIYKLAKKYNLRVIEDAAHSFGSIYKNKKIGSFGDIACFSFDGIKNITSGEGGCIVTNDLEVINKVNDARLLGVIKDTEKRLNNKRSWEFDVKEQGWRFHMSDIMAAIGIVQLQRFKYFAKKRQKLALEYDEMLKEIKEVKFLKHNYHNVVPHIYPIVLSQKISRTALAGMMNDDGIQTGIHYHPNHELSLFKINNIHQLRNVEKISSNIMTLPLHPDLSKRDLKKIIKSLKKNILKLKGN